MGDEIASSIGLAADTQRVYGTNDDITVHSSACASLLVSRTCAYDTDGSGALLKMPLGGGSAVTIVSGQSQPTLLGVSATSVSGENIVESVPPNMR
jgi:hypothetical protein